MIIINNSVKKHQKNFWNQCLFHPTDAVEDSWGKRILDRIAKDGAIETIRIYTMFEDIVYYDENDNLCYDFRLSDLRLDYMIEKGYNLLLAYGGMPDCIASSTANKTSSSKNKTRYKGKMWNTSAPKDYALWEEICYEYTKHIVERYGIETVSNWYCQCFNEPDVPGYFLSDLPNTTEDAVEYRLPAYCEMYRAFERGIRRVSEKICIGGPALAHYHEFLGGWLDFIRENELKLDFISVHNYGTFTWQLNDGSKPISVANQVENHLGHLKTIKDHGFENLPIFVDEWGFSACGFKNRDECPELISRETEVFSAYFAKLIYEFIYRDFKVEMLSICLSGQHEMVEDFTGFRNFFTLNFIAKPIYNAYILASKLHNGLVEAATKTENMFVIPTRNDCGNYSVLISYSSENFKEDLPEITEEIIFEENLAGKKITVWCIDKNTTNPYRLYQKMGIAEIGEKEIVLLREEGNLKPVAEFDAKEKISLKLTTNCVYLVEVK